MRFAKAPLGDLRFRAPVPPSNETSVQDASAVSLSFVFQLVHLPYQGCSCRVLTSVLVQTDMPWHQPHRERKGRRRLPVCQCLDPQWRHTDIKAASHGIHPGRRYTQPHSETLVALRVNLTGSRLHTELECELEWDATRRCI